MKIKKTQMDTLTAITTRKSVRKYTDEPLTEEEINTVLNAGFCSPSAHRMRPWEFIVIRDRDMLDIIAERGKYMKMVFSATTAILVCGDTVKMNTHDFLMHDCAAATQNMLLAAHSIGLGAVWCGISKHKDGMAQFFQELLDIPEHVLPASLVVLGHPESALEIQPDRFEEKKVHFEKF